MYSRILEFTASDFAALVRDHRTFVLTTHINPDGDALGSELGLAEWLLSIGKSVRVINYSVTPENYHFLDKERPIIEWFDPVLHSDPILKSDVFILLDTNDPDRTKTMAPLFGKHPLTALIDHHLEPKDFAKRRFIDTEATSTGELIYTLIHDSEQLLGGTISAKAAQALYVAIMTDTGSFRFPRTDADIFRIAATLVDLGADPVKTYNETYNTARPSRIKLIGKCLNSLQFFFDNRLATQLVTQADLKDAEAIEEEVDGFVQFPLQVGTLEFSVFFLELREGWKISFRSRGNRSAAEVAKNFGGNGHFHAAGARIYDKMLFAELQKMVCDAVAEQLSSN